MERVTMYRTTDIHLHLVKTKERERQDTREAENINDIEN